MTAGRVLVALLTAHVALGVVRLPGKVWLRRTDEIAEYRRHGAARYLLDSAQLSGADQLEWLLANTPEDCIVLWKWPCTGALEFSSALLAPRLVVDERTVPAGAARHLDRPLARGTPPGSADEGVIVLQGTDEGGLRLHVRR